MNLRLTRQRCSSPVLPLVRSMMPAFLTSRVRVCPLPVLLDSRSAPCVFLRVCMPRPACGSLPLPACTLPRMRTCRCLSRSRARARMSGTILRFCVLCRRRQRIPSVRPAPERTPVCPVLRFSRATIAPFPAAARCKMHCGSERDLCPWMCVLPSATSTLLHSSSAPPSASRHRQRTDRRYSFSFPRVPYTLNSRPLNPNP